MRRRSFLAIGTKIIAVRDFGPIREGQPGIVTSLTRVSFLLWSGPAYLCTFFGGVKIMAYPKNVDAHEHEYSLENLEETQAGKSPAEQMRAILGR